MLEGRRAILFKEEMADPGKAVAGHRQRQQQPPRTFADRQRENEDNEAGADKEQATARTVAVFAQVIRVEIGEAVELPGISTVVGPLVIVLPDRCSAGSLFESRVIGGNSQ